MIKKIIACLTICFIITGIISPVFSDASALPQPNWNDPGISEIINISDLTGWMLNGGTFDVSTYTDSESFMNDYYNSRTKTRLVSPTEDPQDDYYEVLPGFGINNQFVPGDIFARPLDTNRVISSSFRDHSGYGRRFSNEVNEALLSTGHLYDTKIPLLNEVEFANFVNYNHDALRLYSEFFQNNDNPTPEPPEIYNFLSNSVDFIWYGTNDLYSYQSNLPMWYNAGWSNNPISIQNMSFSTLSTGTLTLPFNQNNLIPLELLSIYITDVNNTVTCSYSNLRYAWSPNNNTSYPSGYVRYISSNGINNNRLNVSSYDWAYNYQVPNYQTSFAGLSTCVNYIYQHFRHVNIFYNGEPWVLVSNNSSPSVTPEFPDAVGGEELPNSTWPISRPRAPYYTSVPGMLQAIEDAIQGDGKLDIDDLKPYLTDENGDPVPDPIFDPEPVPIPVPDPVNPDIVPGLPVLPAMPPEMPGFSGVSVLAEIINFTNQSLPNSLIVTFWGIVFGIVILGLIKILHK